VVTDILETIKWHSGLVLGFYFLTLLKTKKTSHLRQRVNTLGERMPHGGQIIRMNA